MGAEAVETSSVSHLPVLRMGSTGAQVRHLQQLLNLAGDAGLAEDGEFGPGTDGAMRVFQSQRALVSDGIAGPRTWEALLGSPSPSEEQAPRPGCVNGWTVPPFGSDLRRKALDLLRMSQGFGAQFEVPDIRYFVGPEDADVGGPRPVVERWYGKVVAVDDPSFRIRFLARRTQVGERIAAVAPFDSVGFASPDWLGFDGEGGPTPFPNVPGVWPGPPYDYVAARRLPADVVGCLEGT